MLYDNDEIVDISYVSKTQQDFNAAKTLLKPLGLICTWNLFECAVMRDNQTAVATTCKCGSCRATFSCPEILIYMLMKKILSFTFNDSKNSLVRNPYFGCNSLEEALVKSDLIGDRIEQDI